ncbi:iron complex outermembrane receptor protein [Flavobacteriaceae bacterium MAR_2009_75]|nr:iron complex outermembrane receptor protein [Flavobacteriaceae bacterium MAR_2009_75]
MPQRKNMRTLLIFVALIICSSSMVAQSEGSIKGNIIDLEMAGEPLMFASVSVEGTDHHTETNFNGNFEFTGVEPGTYNLEISSLGYETQLVAIEVLPNDSIQIQQGLSAKSISMEEVSALEKNTSNDFIKSAAYAGQ